MGVLYMYSCDCGTAACFECRGPGFRSCTDPNVARLQLTSRRWRDQEADAAFVHSSHGPHATPRSHGTSSPLASHVHAITAAHASANLC